MCSTLMLDPSPSLLTPETCEFIDNLRTKYGIMGVAVGMVQGENIQTKVFGIADARGNKVTDEARDGCGENQLTAEHLRYRVKFEAFRGDFYGIAD